MNNVPDTVLAQLNDMVWIRTFFRVNIGDFASCFKITDVNQAIYDTIEKMGKAGIKNQSSE
ncbi:MAG: hypothetical protein K2M53_11960 [Muribaculaceae bacterium]|nr:hypothetical protein [Muribaculaceae bacterium]